MKPAAQRDEAARAGMPRLPVCLLPRSPRGKPDGIAATAKSGSGVGSRINNAMRCTCGSSRVTQLSHPICSPADHAAWPQRSRYRGRATDCLLASSRGRKFHSTSDLGREKAQEIEYGRRVHFAPSKSQRPLPRRHSCCLARGGWQQGALADRLRLTISVAWGFR